jgi:hypothetical protein
MNYEQVSSKTLVIHTLPALVSFVAVLFTFGFVVLMLSVLTGFQAGNMLLHPNPFATYQALWPGQPIRSIAQYLQQTPEAHLDCIIQGEPSESYFRLVEFGAEEVMTTHQYRTIDCQLFTDNGVFRAITVTMGADQIRALQFISTGLSEDALYLYWGAPDSFTRCSRFLCLRWDRGTYSAAAWVNERTSVVQRVTITLKE